MTTDYDMDAIARGIDRVEKARKTIDRRQYTDRPGTDWTPGEEGDSHPEVVGTYGKAVLDYSDDGRRFQVNGYTYAGHALFQREYVTLDAALLNGTRVANSGPTPAEHVETWNRVYPEGKAVRYWTGLHERGTEVHVTTDVLGIFHDADGVITVVAPGHEYPYGVSLDTDIYVRAAAHCVTATGTKGDAR